MDRQFCADVSAEKAFEVEANIIRDEIARRLDFSRRLQNIQLILIGILTTEYLKGDLSNIAKDAATIDWLLFAIIAINSVFLLEIRQNIYHIVLAVFYVRNIINNKYAIVKSDKSTGILEWEVFLKAVRTRSVWVHDRISFLMAPDMLMSIYMLCLPCVVYFNIIVSGGLQRVNVLPLIGILSACCLSLYFIWVAIKDGASISDRKENDPDMEAFLKRYWSNSRLDSK